MNMGYVFSEQVLNPVGKFIPEYFVHFMQMKLS
jgi:hypothetical protein